MLFCVVMSVPVVFWDASSLSGTSWSIEWSGVLSEILEQSRNGGRGNALTQRERSMQQNEMLSEIAVFVCFTFLCVPWDEGGLSCGWC